MGIGFAKSGAGFANLEQDGMSPRMNGREVKICSGRTGPRLFMAPEVSSIATLLRLGVSFGLGASSFVASQFFLELSFVSNQLGANAINVLAMGFDGLCAQMKFFCDLGGTLTAAD
jgi:hypothetical protein